MPIVTARSDAPKRFGSLTDLRILCDLLDRNGFDSREVLAAADIEHSAVTRLEGFISRRQERDFQSLFAVVTQHRLDIWVETARRRGYTAWGDFGMAMITAPTLKDAAQLGSALGAGNSYHRAAGDRWFEGIAMTFPDFSPETPEFRFQVVHEVIVAVEFLTELWREPFPFARIDVPIEVRGLGLEDHVDVPLRYWSGPLVFLWSRENDVRPLPRGDAMLHREYLERVARFEIAPERSVGIEERVREVLARPSHSVPRLEDVAGELGLTARTLQRRLADRGLDFRSLREKSLLERAKRMLVAGEESIGDIARSLGYFELSSFSHAFRRWVGETPREFRRRSALRRAERDAA